MDILHARPWIAQRRYVSHQTGDKLVRRVRIAETSAGTTRIVFDLVNPSDFRITKLDAPDRMVIELRPLHRENNDPVPPPVYAPMSSRRGFAYPPAVYARRP